MFSIFQFLFFLPFISRIGAFTIHQLNAPAQTCLNAGPSSVEELISTPDIWGPIKQELDHVPVFSCANEQGQPMQYQIGEKPLAFFFCDIEAAKEDLQKANAETKVDGLQVLPFPLGEAFEMGAKQLAAVIPSVGALESAGAPQGLNPVGQQVPLFGCMEIAANQPDGSSMTPLFFTFEEAEAAMNMALEAAGGGDSKFEVSILPLTKAVQTMATSAEKKYIFEAPTSSLDYLRSTMN